MIDLKIAELRKKKGMTQQELGDILGVSYQTVSKWENNVTMPDIAMLPALSRYFGISVDALLGLVELEEAYRPSDSGQKEYWKNRVEYLKRTRKTLWNEDYLKFLVDRVWHIDRAVDILDCGCGFGALGLLLMPLLPEGSTYTGVDFSEEMLREAKDIWESKRCQARFILADLFDFSSKKKYDMVVSQAVLRHVDNGETVLRKMIELTQDGGLVVSMECNREFEAAGLYIDGMDYASLCCHPGLKKLWKTEYEMQKRDYAIAMKIPHYMRKAGLADVGCRMNDRINYVVPGQEDYEQSLRDVICADHWDDEKSEEQMKRDIAYFMNHGMNREEAEGYCRQQNGIVRYLKEESGKAALTKFTGVMVAFGWKRG